MSSLKKTANEPAVVARAVLYVQRGVRSTRDVTAYLTRLGLNSQQAQSIVEKFVQKGLVNNRACARLWADHFARKGFAWPLIRLKLSEKGLDDQAIDAANERGSLSATDRQRALGLIAQWRSKRSALSGKVALARRLASYGFEEELINELTESFPDSGNPLSNDD